MVTNSARGALPKRLVAPATGLLALALLLASLASASAEKRVALVIGNSAYQHTVALKNPSNDATDIAAKLRGLGFDVIDGNDLSKDEMETRIRSFADKLQGADVGLFFYAGHGLAVDGKNYLAPVDVKLQNETDLDFEAVELDLVLKQMERNSRVSIVFLDACRDNPLAVNLASTSRSLEVSRGLARIDRAVGMMIAFSTQPGNVALDGQGRNSPFTDALLHHIDTEGESINDVMIDVRRDVLKTTDGKQVPWENSSLTGQFFFKPAAPKTATDENTETAAQITALRQEIDKLQAEQGAKLKSQGDELAILQQKLQTETNRAAAQGQPVPPQDADRAIAVEGTNAPPSPSSASIADSSKSTPPQSSASATDTSPPQDKPSAPADLQAQSRVPDAKDKEPDPNDEKLAAVEPGGTEPNGPPVAAQATPPAPEPLDRRELLHDMLSALKDLGCYRGSVNASWNSRSRAALDRFNRTAKLELSLDEPQQASLEALRSWNGPGCPVEKVYVPPPPRQAVTPPPRRQYRANARRYAPSSEREASSPPPSRHSGGGGDNRVDEQQEVQKFFGVR